MCFCVRNTVSSAIKRFLQLGIEGLFDKPRSGCPKKLTSSQERFLFASLFQPPRYFGFFSTVWTIALMVHSLEKSFGKKVSPSLLKALLHHRGWNWNRPKHIIKEVNPLNPQEQLELLRILTNKSENEVLLFGDESDFEWLPFLSGMWMLKGVQAEVPTSGTNKVLCCFGFFNPQDKQFYYKFVEGRSKKTAKNFIASLHQIREQFKGKQVHLWLDNASIHNEKTKLLKGFREKYGNEILIHFLPKKAPLLNPIERFWKFLKGKVCSNWLYEDIKELRTELRHFCWHYREGEISYDFKIKNLINVWKNWPVIQAS